MPSIGEAVRRLRRKLGYSQGDVIKRSEGRLSQAWLASLEVGRVKHSNPEMLAILAKVLGVSIVDIYREAGIDVSSALAPSPTGASPEEQELIAIYRDLPQHEKRHLIAIGKTLKRNQDPEERNP